MHKAVSSTFPQFLTMPFAKSFKFEMLFSIHGQETITASPTT